MNQSENIGDLAKALAAAVAEIKPPTKGRHVKVEGKEGRRGYEYSYADLADVIESYRKPLAAHGLSIVQPIHAEGGHLVIVTRLLHESGQWLSSDYPVPTYQKPQDTGSALTYARRYAVSALLGIAAEDDDDGARAQEGVPTKREERAPVPPAEAPAVKPPADPLTDGDIEKVGTLAKRAGLLKHADLKPVLKKLAGVETLRALDRAFLPELLKSLQAMGDAGISKDVDEFLGAPANA